jgi:mRNA interferase HicA
MKSNEFKRWLSAQGASFKPGKGSRPEGRVNGKRSVLPTHNKELGAGLVFAIKRQSGLK